MIVNHLLFADDICVFDPSIRGLQRRLNVLRLCCWTWKFF